MQMVARLSTNIMAKNRIARETKTTIKQAFCATLLVQGELSSAPEDRSSSVSLVN